MQGSTSYLSVAAICCDPWMWVTMFVAHDICAVTSASCITKMGRSLARPEFHISSFCPTLVQLCPMPNCATVPRFGQPGARAICHQRSVDCRFENIKVAASGNRNGAEAVSKFEGKRRRYSRGLWFPCTQRPRLRVTRQLKTCLPSWVACGSPDDDSLCVGVCMALLSDLVYSSLECTSDRSCTLGRTLRPARASARYAKGCLFCWDVARLADEQWPLPIAAATRNVIEVLDSIYVLTVAATVIGRTVLYAATNLSGPRDLQDLVMARAGRRLAGEGEVAWTQVAVFQVASMGQVGGEAPRKGTRASPACACDHVTPATSRIVLMYAALSCSDSLGHGR